MHGNLVKHLCKESKKKEKLQINKMHIHTQDLDMLGICDK